MEPLRLTVSEERVQTLYSLLCERRDYIYQSSIGGRYFRHLEEIPEIVEFVRDPLFESYGRKVLGEIPLAYLSLSGLEVFPGEPGIGAHRDYPHSTYDDDSKEHLCVQFLLSLDGTDEDRAPLWLGNPSNKVVLKPGEMLVYGGNVLHGVHPNQATRPRMTLLWSMGPTWIRPMQIALWDWIAYLNQK